MAVCPFNALRMVADKKGFLHPQPNSELCKKCGRCSTVCPVVQERRSIEPKAIYVAKTEDDDLRKVSASGGVFGELARVVLARDGVVVGAMWERSGRRVVHGAIERWEDIGKLNGSKYAQSDLVGMYENIRQWLNEGRGVLFSGTPCQVAALKNFIGNDNDNLITVALICYGVPSPLALECFLESEERKSGSKLVRFCFREKDLRTDGMVSRIEFADKTKNRVFSYTTSPYSRALFNNLTTRSACLACKFRQGRSGADLQIGDCWGLREQGDSFDDGRGLSAVLVNTIKGETLFRQAKLLQKKISYDYVLAHNPMLVKSPKRNPRQAAFYNDLCAGKDFTECVARYLRPSLAGRVMGRIKLLLGIK